MENHQPSASSQVEAFYAHLGAERGLSANTLAAYRRDTGDFLRFLQPRGHALCAARREDIAAFLAERAREGLSSASLARRLACLRSLYRFLASEGLVTGNPAREVPAPRAGFHLPVTLRRGEVDRLIEEGPAGATEARNRAMLETFYASGLRVSEMAGLRLGDVNLEVGFVRARGKGSKERVVPLGASARERIREYLESVRRRRPQEAPETQPLFLSSKGGRLDRSAIYRIVKTASARAELPGATSPHTLRHTFASHLVAGGADLRAVQEMLGHASVATTQVYTHVENRWLKEVHTRFHPRSAGKVDARGGTGDKEKGRPAEPTALA